MINLFFIISMVLAHAHPSYKLDCGKDGEIRSFAVNSSGGECSAYTKMGMSCGDTKSPGYSNSTIALRSPVDQYYSNRDSRNYDRALIERTVKDSVCEGMDPYLAVGILLIEAPPFNAHNKMYLNAFGVPPLDSIAIAAAMHCSLIKRDSSEKPKLIESSDGKPPVDVNIYDRQVYPYLAKSIGSIPTINLLGANGDRTKIFYAKLDKVGNGNGGSPSFTKDLNDCKDSCCVQVRVPDSTKIVIQDPSKLSPDRDLVEKAFKMKLGHIFVDQKLQNWTRIASAKNAKTPFEKFSLQTQGYNGFGRLGVTEKVGKSCLTGISMREHPLYGAGVGESMLNAAMSNSEIRGMATKASRQCENRPIKSLLCEHLGLGQHIVDPREFARLQNRYLEGRNCPQHTYDFKAQLLPGKPFKDREQEEDLDSEEMRPIEGGGDGSGAHK